VQRLQFFLSESPWDLPSVNALRLEILLRDPGTRPHEEGVLIIDETADRKDGRKTAHVARQYLGSVGKVDNGIVVVTSLWADERVYYPLHIEPYEPAERLPKGKKDPAFRTKPQIGMALVDQALSLGIPFRAVVADCVYGESDAFEGALWEAGVPYVLGLKPNKGRWAPEEEPHTPQEAAQQVRWEGPDAPGEWNPVLRRFRDGHTETWWAAELTLAGSGPDKSTRLVVATIDPATLPAENTWYLATNLPRPGSARAQEWPVPPADLEEIVRLYGLRNWVEQSYKQAKQELGWADFQVRQDRAIRRHWELVCCAFSFCWWAQGHPQQRSATAGEEPKAAAREARESALEKPEAPREEPVAGGKRRARSPRVLGGGPLETGALLARGIASGPRVAHPVEFALALVASVERVAPAARTANAP
jgi:SRSO17 transposase